MRLSEGVVLALLTGTSYLMAFGYEGGWARAFGFPAEMIDLQLTPALFTALISLSGLVVLFQIADPLATMFMPKADEHPVWREIRSIAALLLVVLAFLVVGGPVVLQEVLWALGVVLVLGLWLLIAPLILFRGVPGYAAKLRASQQIDDQIQRPVNQLLFSFGWTVPLLVLAALAIGLSHTAGYARAKQASSFLVTNQNPETVVLRIYGQRAITAELLRKEKQIRRVYRVIKIDDTGLALRQERVGPLSLED